MFKKTLLAMTIATISATAVNASSLNSGVTFDNVTGVTPGSINATTGDCQDVADDLGVTLDTGTGAGSPFANDPGSDAVTLTVGTTLVVSTSSVTMTATDTCAVVAADTASTAATTSSIEFVNKTGNNVSLAPSLVAGSGGYATGDIITFNVSGATIDAANSTPTLTSTVNTTSFFDISATAVRFEADAAITGGAVLTLGGTNLSATGLDSTSEVSVSGFATRGAVDFDAASVFKAATLAPQYTATVSQVLNGVVDVGQDRQAIVLNAAQEAAANKDQLSVKVKLDVTGNALTPKETTYKISGDFAWLSASAQTTVDAVAVTPAELSTYLTAGFYVGTGDDTVKSITLNADMNELTVVTNAVTADIDTESNFLFNVAGQSAPGATTQNPTLAATTFDVIVTVADTTATSIVLAAGTTMSAGAWTLNGSTIEIPYMPFGDNTQVIMRQTITGAQSGDLSVRYMLEGVDSTWNDAGVVGTSAPGVQNIASLVMEAIKLDAGVASGKVAIELTSNVPSTSTTTYAAYKVISEQDRGFVGVFGTN